MRNSKKIMSVLVTLSPLLNNYMVPGIGVNAGLCVVLLFVVYSFIAYPRIANPFASFKSRGNYGKIIVNIMFFYLLVNALAAYTRGDSEVSVFVNVAITYLVLFPAIKRLRLDLIDKEVMLKTIETIAVLCGVVICAQYVLYYGAGFNERWFWVPFKSCTYVYGSNILSSAVMSGLFRPSGIFTEPSHYSIYACLALAHRLFTYKKLTDRTSIFITLACILSTSGMGIAFVTCIWVYYVIICDVSPRNKLMIIVASSIIALLAFAGLYRFDFFRLSLERMFSTSGSLENAYTGRMFTSYLLDNLNTIQRWWGMGYRNIPISINSLGEAAGIYMVAIVELQYCLGYIGTVIFLLVCVYLLFKAKGFNRLVVIMYIARVFISGVVSLPSLFFYAAVVSEVFYSEKLITAKTERLVNKRRPCEMQLRTKDEDDWKLGLEWIIR